MILASLIPFVLVSAWSVAIALLLRRALGTRGFTQVARALRVVPLLALVALIAVRH